MSTTAEDLAGEIGANYQTIARYDIGSDGWETYTNPCGRGCVNFAVDPGESYNVRVSHATVLNPSHY
jgi:hypothetical protein